MEVSSVLTESSMDECALISNVVSIPTKLWLSFTKSRPIDSGFFVQEEINRKIIATPNMTANEVIRIVLNSIDRLKIKY